ncbi:hypothetical protein ACTWP5_12555 [Streptomyces sp. 4N509B]|uniref:hypothetical protein n=1 Tax=Streptomyces sp. 4N509B TaxID=3457413 RepID=UPI003FCFC119
MAGVAAAGLLALTACGSEEEPSSEGTGGQESTEGASGENGGGEEADGESLASLSPEEIADRAQRALQSATSMRVTTLGDPGALGIGLDLHMDQGGSCAGSVTQPGAGSIELLVREDDEVWMKPDTEFWQSQLGVADTGVISLLDGSYLYGHTSDPELSQMAGTCSLTAMQSSIESDDGSGGPDEVGPETEYNGVPAITISGPDAEGNEVTMLVATEGEPYPLLVRTMTDGTESEIELSQFNEPVAIEEPPAEQVLNIADFRTGNIEP